MKTLLIPDIHNKIAIAQQIIDNEPCDQRVFLGDIYDDFYDSVTIVEKVANWHKAQLADPKNTFLFGNHDAAYAFSNNRNLYCSGWTLAKSVQINNILSADDWSKTKLTTVVDDWLISHAGVHLSMMDDLLQIGSEEIIKQARKGLVPRLLGAGKARGGYQIVGGVTWLDWDYEFEPTAEKQIVGHTPHRKIKQYKQTENFDIDTHLNDYVIITDGALEFKKVSFIGKV